MRAINAAQSTVGQVAAKYNQAATAAGQIQERLGSLKEQAGKAGAAINCIAGHVSPSLSNIMPMGSFAPQLSPATEAVKPFPHLLIMQPLDTAAFEELRRQTSFRWAGQERLTRSRPGRGQDQSQGRDFSGLQRRAQTAGHLALYRATSAAGEPDHGLR